MKVLYLSEYNEGGGAKSSLSLAIAASEYADVTLLGIGFNYPEYRQINFIETHAKKSTSIKYILGLRSSLNRIKPDIVHANGMYTGLLAYVLRPLSKRTYKIIMTLRHTSLKFRFGIIAKLFIKALNKVDVVHYLTTYQKDLYSNLGLVPHRYQIIPNIIYTYSYPVNETIELRNKLLADTLSDRLIVFVGRIVESKQVDVFIDVINTIILKGFNVAGIIVGNGDSAYLEKLNDLSVKLGISKKIVFTGFSTKPELFIKAADFCLFPTMWDEALPRFIIESFSQNRTLVVSNHPSIKGIITDKYDSLVVKKHTTEEYAEKCIELITNATLLKQLELGAEKTYNEHYQSDRVVQEYATLYAELLQNHVLIN